MYEIKDSVKLTCHAEGITVAVYDIKWCKQNGSNGNLKQLRTKGSYVNGMWTETLSLTRLSEQDEGTYICQIYRYPLQHRAIEFVNITVKGNENFNQFIEISLIVDCSCYAFPCNHYVC